MGKKWLGWKRNELHRCASPVLNMVSVSIKREYASHAMQFADLLHTKLKGRGRKQRTSSPPMFSTDAFVGKWWNWQTQQT